MDRGRLAGMGVLVGVGDRFEKSAVNVHKHPSKSTIVLDIY